MYLYMKVDIINLFAAEGTVCPQLLSLMNPLNIIYFL